MLSIRPYDIYIVGLGMVGQRQITAEADAALRRSNEIYALHYEARLIDYLSSICPSVKDLSALYEPNAPRNAIYRKMAELVLQGASRNPPVAFAAYGHPMIYVQPTSLIREASTLRNLRTAVLPGISALDGLLIDLSLDPGVEGLQMYEATDLLVRRRPLQVDVPALIWQIGAVETLVYSVSPNTSQRFLRLKEYLLEFYPGDHEVVIARTPTLPIASPRLLRVKLAELERLYDQIESADTLYIPVVHHRKVQDQEFVRSMSGWGESVQSLEKDSTTNMAPKLQ